MWSHIETFICFGKKNIGLVVDDAAAAKGLVKGTVHIQVLSLHVSLAVAAASISFLALILYFLLSVVIVCDMVWLKGKKKKKLLTRCGPLSPAVNRPLFALFSYWTRWDTCGRL